MSKINFSFLPSSTSDPRILDFNPQLGVCTLLLVLLTYSKWPRKARIM